MGDAIARTLVRLFVTRRHLLEWVHGGAGDDRSPARPRRASIAGWPAALVIGAAGGWSVAWLAGHGTVAAGAAVRGALDRLAGDRALGQPVAARSPAGSPVSAADARALRLTARRTWRFFETFVTAADNMLPPDNFQEDPAPALAHRTSPTNLGLYLLSTVSARDFGWIGTVEAIERLEATLATMSGLARFRGHFYNWYDTRDSAAARSADTSPRSTAAISPAT